LGGRKAGSRGKIRGGGVEEREVGPGSIEISHANENKEVECIQYFATLKGVGYLGVVVPDKFSRHPPLVFYAER
jgi:hypothetical protein